MAHEWCKEAVSNVTPTVSGSSSGTSSYASYLNQYYAQNNSQNANTNQTTTTQVAQTTMPTNPYSVNQPNPYKNMQYQSNSYQNQTVPPPPLPPPSIPSTNWQTQVSVTTQSVPQQQYQQYSYPQYSGIVQQHNLQGNMHQAYQQQQYQQQQYQQQQYQQQQYQLQQYQQQQYQQQQQLPQTYAQQPTVQIATYNSTTTPSYQPHTVSVGMQQISKPNPTRFMNPPPPPENKQQNGEYPVKLKKFVENSFANCKDEEDRKHISEALRKIIEYVKNQDRLHEHRWDLEPIPQLPKKTNSTTFSINLNNLQNDPSSNNSSPRANESRKRKNRFTPNDNDDSNNKSSIYGPTTGFDSSESMLSSRANRFKQSFEDDSKKSYSQNNKNNKKSRQKKQFNDDEQEEEFNPENLKIVGTSQSLEKRYLRLTAPPDPSTVRPQEVLEVALKVLKEKWGKKECEYEYMCSQLKAIRQDVTLQHIQNEFAVLCYELHARIALECSDLNEYNQCQTQLKNLYAKGINGSVTEFTAYRILYYVYLQGNKKYQSGSSDLAFMMASLSPELTAEPAVAHALKVMMAILQENYHKFFTLYKHTPNMGNNILDLMLDTWRIQFLQQICKSYKPSVPFEFVAKELAFKEILSAKQFVETAGCLLINNDNKEEDIEINTKDTVINLAAVFTQEKLLL